MLSKSKVCPACGKEYPLTTGYWHRNKSRKGGYAAYCKRCTCKKHQEEYYARPENRRLIQRKGKLYKKYGITLEQYNKLLEDQGGGCAICGRSKPKEQHREYLCVDHDHKTGKTRGILCEECNRGLGSFKDDPALLVIARAYLMRNGK